MNTTLLAGLAIAGLIGLPGSALAATYYVSNGGDDRSDGRTQGTALSTLAEAAGRVQRGDTILLRRGDVFRESVDIGAPDIQINAYGPADAEMPAVSGSVLITGWQPYRDSIYVAQTDAKVGYLFVNRRLMTIARYPNTGWLRTRAWREEIPRGEGRRRRGGGGKTFVTCPDLAGHARNTEGYWVGANIRWRHHSWWYETRPVVGYDGAGELTLGDRSFEDTGPFGSDDKGWGFYLDGKLEELDAPGEWYFDAEAGKVYLYAPDGADPNGSLVEGSARSTGLRVRNAAVRNVCFRHQKDVGLEIDGRCVVENCLFESIGRDATVGERGAGGAGLNAVPSVREARVRHSEFRSNLNHSIAWWQDPQSPGSSVIEHNTIVNSGTVPGYGGSGSWHAVGILIGRGANVHVRYNRIDGTGYAGILLGSDGNVAEYNVIRNAMSTLNDGAGIYTNCSRSTIRHNIILDAKGGMESSGTWPNISHGIWLEFLGNYRESIVEGNTCARCGADGLFLTNNYECVVRDNVLYDNERFQLLLTGRGESESEDLTQDHLIVGNVLYATRPPQKVLYFDPRFDYGTLRANYYYSPHTDEPLVAGIGWPGTGQETNLTLASWQRDYAWADREARTDPEKPGSHDAADRSELFVNDSQSAKSIPLDGAYRDLDANPVEGSVELAPFSSRVLIRVERATE
jgi:parallel beta-helix repeat protein